MPSTLHDSLLARLDRLAPVKEIAQIGAALGREFSHGLLAAVASDAQFTGSAAIPDGYTASTVAIPRPTDTLFLKLRDDDSVVATAKPNVVDR